MTFTPSPLEQQIDDVQRKREALLRQHSFFQLKVHLVSGRNLIAMDKSGTSDPYVKFKLGSRLLYKSKTVHKDLNPTFDEVFTVPIEDPFQPINIKVSSGCNIKPGKCNITSKFSSQMNRKNSKTKF